MISGSRLIHSSFIQSIILFDQLTAQAPLIEQIANLIIERLKQGNKLILFGNGGSAADSQHIATELVGGFRDHTRPSLPAMALTADTVALTAIGNDYGYEDLFARQLQGLMKDGDVVLGISTSGNSKNVLKALKTARLNGGAVIGFTGRDGGKMKELCDLCLCVPSDDTPKIQEGHITTGHIIAELIEIGMSEK